MKPIKPKDISYCRHHACRRDCERNLNTHNVVGVMSVILNDIEDVNECEYYRKDERDYD